MLRGDMLGDEYRARARLALVTAGESALLEVRRKHETAAAVWAALAEREERLIAWRIAASVRPRRARSHVHRALPGDIPCTP